MKTKLSKMEIELRAVLKERLINNIICPICHSSDRNIATGNMTKEKYTCNECLHVWGVNENYR